MLKNIRNQAVSFVVGFYSAQELFVAQSWRPREEDDEICDFPEACERVRSLCRSMDARESVDGLVPSSVFVQDPATGEFLFSRTADGFQSVVAEDSDARARLVVLSMVAAYHASPDVARALDQAARGFGGVSA